MTNEDTKKSPYSEKIWLKSYDAHVKPNIDLEYYSSKNYYCYLVAISDD